MRGTHLGKFFLFGGASSWAGALWLEREYRLPRWLMLGETEGQGGSLLDLFIGSCPLHRS